MEIRLYNSLSKKLDVFAPLGGNTVRMYSCGPTVYNYAHIGNMRAFLFADLLQRVLKNAGKFEIKWVMNITDIDDKTIRDSSPGSAVWREEMGSQTGDPMSNLKKFTDFYLGAFLADIAKLGINTNDFLCMPRATEYIIPMQELIRKIYNKGIAYQSGGSIYFNVSEWRKKDTYGKLFNIDFDNFKAGARIDADEYEREQVSDFVLWKANKPGEPCWDFELDGESYPGRPGWHIECSAMEYELLGLPFDIHTGGIDLKFPHHEDEIAQSKAGYGVEPTAIWCHNEFLEVEGEKMSKSKGNYYTLRDLIDKGIDPCDIRFSMLSSHYSSIFNFTFDGIASARKGRLRIQEYIYDLFDENIQSGIGDVDIDKLMSDVCSHLADDLHTPKSLAALFSFINNNPVSGFNTEARQKLAGFLKNYNKIFSAWEFAPRQAVTIEIPDSVVLLAEQRIAARKSGNYSEADILRQQIHDAGFIVKDTKNGYEIGKI